MALKVWTALLPLLAFEGADYGLGLEATTVTGGLFSVVKANIVPILTLMGIMLGVALVRRMAGRAKKGGI